MVSLKYALAAAASAAAVAASAGSAQRHAPRMLLVRQHSTATATATLGASDNSAGATASTSLSGSATAGTGASSSSASTSSTSTASNDSDSDSEKQPGYYKVIGICLAVGSGILIGSSFVVKKKGLIASKKNTDQAAGEGHAYLKNAVWWIGMIMMIAGEALNFVAYMFTEAILVTPLGALAVVVCAVLSAIFLKERLTFFAKVGCVLCILGSVIIALNGPAEQSASTMHEFKDYFVTPGFLTWTGICLLVSLFLVVYGGRRWGKKSMLVYISVCSLCGGLSVTCTQAVGSAIMASIKGNNQFTYWFTYFILVFVIITLLIEINYLNKALDLFNTAMVTPTYYVMFTGLTMISSIILYRGLRESPEAIVTLVFGFLVICCGITLLQMSKIDPVESNLTTTDQHEPLLPDAQNVSQTPSSSQCSFHEKDDPPHEQRIDLDGNVITSPHPDGEPGILHSATMSSRRSSYNDAQPPVSAAHTHGIFGLPHEDPHDGDDAADPGVDMLLPARIQLGPVIRRASRLQHQFSLHHGSRHDNDDNHSSRRGSTHYINTLTPAPESPSFDRMDSFNDDASFPIKSPEEMGRLERKSTDSSDFKFPARDVESPDLDSVPSLKFPAPPASKRRPLPKPINTSAAHLRSPSFLNRLATLVSPNSATQRQSQHGSVDVEDNEYRARAPPAPRARFATTSSYVDTPYTYNAPREPVRDEPAPPYAYYDDVLSSGRLSRLRPESRPPPPPRSFEDDISYDMRLD